ncbi:DUF402 domain-containing protein [Bacillaceae bacterium SIJ1]|uniref:DUF402 domain-containing protein n=1 Tax=Litoribacterium kuwaitense TaxID=1398745 RepID=UPI0013EBF04B|nr:DUF402 domain-containing protein [Litoribacterium kuwaitense]NGP45099.1 DUF402 domain-containing protein [Litoribacterium kuwaitense]
MELEQGKIISYYCNVAMPSVIRNDELSFVDLDLDLVKESNEDWKVVDEEEFTMNSQTYHYPAALKDNAIKALATLKEKAKQESFPFDEAVLKTLNLKDDDADGENSLLNAETPPKREREHESCTI